MATYDQFIGTEISFDSVSLAKTTASFQKHLLPALNELKKAYEALNLGPFSQTILNTLRTPKGIEAIRKEYVESLNEENEEALNSAAMMIAGLQSKMEKSEYSLRDAQNHNNGDGIYLQWQHVIVVNGEPGLDQTALTAHFTLRIQTEIQARLYEKALAIVNAQNEIVTLIKNNNVRLPWSTHLFSPAENVIVTEKDGLLSVAKGAPFLIDRLKRE